MLPVIIGLIAFLVATFIGFVATRPDSFRVQRTTRIAAPPEAIAAHLDDFRAWSAWSPYEKLDPAMKRSYAGAPRGVGAIYEWSGNSKAGEGRMEIIEATPARVAMQLDFTRPMRAHNVAEFLLVPDGTATSVTWGMNGNAAFATKLFGLFMNMDHLIGRDFETGLANLKALCEGAPTGARAGTA